VVIPALKERRQAGLYVLLLFIISLKKESQTNYLKIYQTDV